MFSRKTFCLFIYLLAFPKCYATQTTESPQNHAVVMQTSSEVDWEMCQSLQSDSSTESIVCPKHTREIKDAFESIRDVWNGDADVAMTSGDKMMTVKRSGLIPIISSRSKQRKILIVKPLKVQTFEDLTRKSGCFGHALDAGVLGLGSFLPSNINGRNVCPYDLRLATTINYSCMPGAKDAWNDFLTPSDRERMCKLCLGNPDSSTEANCNADSYNRYYGSNGIERCLEDKRSDFAVGDLDDVMNLPSGTKIMCRNGTMVDSLQSVDDGCPVITVPYIQFVADYANERLKEIRESVLKTLDPDEFYGNFESPEPMHEEEIIFGNIDSCEQLAETEILRGGIIETSSGVTHAPRFIPELIFVIVTLYLN